MSGLIGATHNGRYTLFRDGYTASSGVERVADIPLKQNGGWITEIKIVLWAWDGGTDSGNTFLAPEAGAEPLIDAASPRCSYLRITVL